MSHRPSWVATLMVVLVHGMALFGWSAPSPRMGSSRPSGASIIHARHLFAPSAPRQAAAAMRASGTRAGSARTEDFAAASSAFRRLELLEQRSESADQELVQQQPVLPEKAREESFLDYLPRSKLSAAARPLTNVDILFPPDVAGIVDLKVQITLFIDEYGMVRKVRFDGEPISSVFSTVILETFLNARFKPGELESTAVRSQLRLEVEFHANKTS